MGTSFHDMTFDEAQAWWAADAPRFARDYGIHFPDARAYLPPALGRNFDLAMDAQPQLVTTTNAGIPAFLANYLDPNLIQVLLTPNKAAEILGETKKGDWKTMSAMFPIVESTGEVSTYGDWNNNGSTGANVNFPTRQSYHYQTMTKWGERQLDMAALAKINWAAQLNVSSAKVLDKFQNDTYFFGLNGLQLYGLLTDPNLTAPLTPATKAASGAGTKWVLNNQIVATPNEIYNDIQSLFIQLTQQTQGLLSDDNKIEQDSKLTVALHPTSAIALTAANSFGVNVRKLLEESFPNIRFIKATQYSTTAGQLVQMIADDIEGQPTGTCGFTEKMRAHTIVRETSAFHQKKSQGTWGAIIFRPICIAQMLGV